MSSEPQLFKVNPETKDSESMREIEFADLGFQERQHIQEWVAKNPGILGDELLIIGKEFSGFDRTNERLDLLAVDEDGKLVVIELKRDDSGSDVHWQAIKYASYLHRFDTEGIIGMLANYAKVSREEAANKLLQHLNADDLNGLNNDQRIILASHRFAPEVTSAALWLNEKAPGEDLMTCVQLTPYQDAGTGSLYVQANRIIPVPGIEDYVVSVGESPGGDRPLGLGEKLSQTFARNKRDGVTRFLRGVATLAIDGLPSNIKPDKKSRWAGGHPTWRYYHLWYSSPLWANWEGMSYRINLWRTDEGTPITDSCRAEVVFSSGGVLSEDELERIEELLKDNRTDLDLMRKGDAREALGVDSPAGALDEPRAHTLADTLKHFIEIITPAVTKLEDERNQE